ncbi:hypothetical protein RHMOL_Rhmol06G0256100 [Rhododendron molle]|uniref:Uncharacterized protein n=2 Tax=Rhododendron molle TaxID=49168 RepID=A0ACC0NG04_RHOML|nr:hypothetical protein RHMOL_Rhmol06G0256100 [Rhododendron molle]KAI8552304.1 hypothetical protein RHMOL_Rhmol06G0256100 [Rhododendron molle]
MGSLTAAAAAISTQIPPGMQTYSTGFLTMGALTATVAAISTQKSPAIFDGRFRGLNKRTGPSCVHMYPKLQNFNSGRMKLQVKCSGRRVPITHASRTQSTSLICSAAPGGAVETRPVTIKSPTEAPIIGLVNTPKLDDGGPGFPPRDDEGGGGGGGGGGSSSGGFFLFAFLLFLSYLKDLEAEKES